MKEIKTVNTGMTKRQKESIFRHQQKRVDELTQLLLTKGINPKQSDEALPMQLLKNDGTLSFSQKADLLEHLYQLHQDASLIGEFVAVFIDMMFKFRQIDKKGTLKLNETCKNQANARVRR